MHKRARSFRGALAAGFPPTLVVALLFLGGCNVLSPFEPGGSDRDKVELGESCLNEGDFGCAQEHYSAIAEPSLRAEKMCSLGLTRAGLKLSVLIDVVIEGGGDSKYLGNLAKAVSPWTEEKNDAAISATKNCSDFVTLANTRRAALLRTLSAIVRCGTAVSRSAVFTTEDGATCTATGVTGEPTQNTISVDPGGVVTPGNPGMCTEDAVACIDDFLQLGILSLSQPGLEPIKKAYDNAPPDLQDQANAALPADQRGELARSALRGTL